MPKTQERIPLLKEGDEFPFQGWTCTVTKVNAFGFEKHYGFTARIDGFYESFMAGWVPVRWIDASLTGEQIEHFRNKHRK